MNKCERTRKLLIMHYQAYPKLQIQDIFKFLYQSALFVTAYSLFPKKNLIKL